MITEQQQKTLATKRKKRARFDAQTIKIDQDWTVRRADELNWELLYQGQFKGYYARLCNALDALPAKMLDEVAKNSLADVYQSVRAIQETLSKALDAS